MLAVILKILSILGIVLLILLGILFLILLLVLFLPIVYRIQAEKNADSILINGKLRWLFGFVRAKILYPDPGGIVVKCLWFTLYDSANTAVKEKKTKEKKKNKTEKPSVISETNTQTEYNAESENADTSEPDMHEEQTQTLKEKLFAKYEKIKYTLKKIYDKIKHILENIAFYKELLQDPETKGLISHGWKRLEKILKSIRPRKLKANLIFGTGSPDTTGYTFGIYGMIMPKLGSGVVVTPDFTRQIFEGQLDASGHIMIFTLLRHILAVLFDKRLSLLKKRLDAHQQKKKPKT